MPTTTLAEQLFSKLTAFQALSALVNSTPPTFESEILDFKGAAKLTDDKLKEVWSKCLSGFANSGGGVLVFGIDCRKDAATGIDCASSLSLAPSAHVMKSRLLELHSSATDPPIQGIQVEAYTSNPKDDAGFVVCLVPESPDRPHRAEHANKQYYIRAGDDFCIAGVSLLRSLFYPHSRSRLVPFLIINPQGSGPKSGLTFDIKIGNAGTATAYDMFSVIAHKKTLHPLVTRVEGVELVQGEHNPYPVTTPGKHLHPGMQTGLLRFAFPQFTSENRGPIEMVLTVDIYSKDGEPIRWFFDAVTMIWLRRPTGRSQLARSQYSTAQSDGGRASKASPAATAKK